jgi:hypothetical protein
VVAACSSPAAQASRAPTTSAPAPVAVVPAIRVVSLPVAPPPRRNATAAFDGATQTVALFGGEGSYGSLHDTWTWDGRGWTEQHPRTVPPARSGATMAFDSISREVLMTGGMADVPLTDPCERRPGQVPKCTPPASLRGIRLPGDLWAWDGHDWHRLVTEETQPRALALATDARNRHVVLLRSHYPVLNTFTWDNRAWVYRPNGLPRGSASIGLAFDASARVTVAVETYQPGVCMPQTGCSEPARTVSQTWDGHTWTAARDRGLPTVSRDLVDPTTLTSDPADHGLLAFDANDNTWRRTGTTWTLIAPSPRSPQRRFMALAADPARHEVIAFGGYPASTARQPVALHLTNDTWVWNGTGWTRFRAPVTPASLPAPPTQQSCVLNGPALVPGQPHAQGGEIRLDVSDLFGVAPCRLVTALRLVITDSHGVTLPIAGNGARVEVSTDVATISGTGVLSDSWTWTNPCAPPGGSQAAFQAFGAGAFPTPITIPVAVPAATCTPGRLSRLTADPIAIRS